MSSVLEFLGEFLRVNRRSCSLKKKKKVAFMRQQIYLGVFFDKNIEYLFCLIFPQKVGNYFLKQKINTHNSKSSFFLSKNSTLISRENCRFFGWKIRENVVILDFFKLLATLISREKLSRKFWVKNSWKRWGFVNIEFLDKTLTFRIAWFWGPSPVKS